MERRQGTRSTTVRVDGDALRNELQKRNLKASEASKEMGFSSQYINNMIADAKRCGRGNIVHISKAAVNLLFEMFNIRPESILYVEQKITPDVVEQKDSGTITMDEDTLYRIIYAAVYAAVKQAWNE